MSRFTAPNDWDGGFYTKSSFFNHFIDSFEFIKKKPQWPTVNDLGVELKTNSITTSSKLLLQPYNQNDIPLLDCPIDYENLIYERGLILTRPENWHDFFNIIIWLNFPKTKGLLNEWHFKENNQKSIQKRSALQNTIAHFDECGMIILSDKPELFYLIKEHNWREFFCENKKIVKKHIKCLVFGHSILERLLNPYVGLTSKCIFFEVDQSLLNQNSSECISKADTLCFDFLTENKANFSSFKLQPFPMLGMTEIIENDNDDYINHENYFREKTVNR